jgi:hypothetical protein
VLTTETRDYNAGMKTEFYESDPFSPRKAGLLLTIDTDYRFEKGEEVVIDEGGRMTKIRVMHVNIQVKNGVLSREILGLKL